MRLIKKTASLLMICLLIVTLLPFTACSGKSAFGLYGRDVRNWAKHYRLNDPDALDVLYRGQIYHIDDPVYVNSAYIALKNLEIAGTSYFGGGSVPADPPTVFTFSPKRGNPVQFVFIGSYLVPDQSSGAPFYSCRGLEKLIFLNGFIPPGAEASSVSPADGADTPSDITVQTNNLQLVEYDGGYFSIKAPAGWSIETMGAYSSFGIRCWDPDDLDYEFFYYGSLSPFLKSEAAKEWNRRQAAIVYNNMSYYHLFADAPAIDQNDFASVLLHWNEFAACVNKYEGIYTNYCTFPAVNNPSILERIPVSTLFSRVSSNEAVVLAGFQSGTGTQCTGKFSGSLIPGYPQYTDGIDQSMIEVICMTGVMAPEEDFYNVEGTLTEAVSSLRFSDAYVKEAQQASEQSTASAAADNAALQAVFDRCNQAWSDYIRN